MVKVAAKDLELDHIDVKTAFLNPLLQEQIYMQIPDLLRDFKPSLKGEVKYISYYSLTIC